MEPEVAAADLGDIASLEGLGDLLADITAVAETLEPVSEPVSEPVEVD